MSEVDDARGMSSIFVAIREEPEEIARGVEAVLLEDFRTAGADALEESNGSVGRDWHAPIVRDLQRLYDVKRDEG